MSSALLKDTLLEAIRSRRARVGIIGLGYVGLPLVLRFTEAGFSVLGFDVDPEKVSKLNGGESYIRHIPSERVRDLVGAERFEARPISPVWPPSIASSSASRRPRTPRRIPISNTSRTPRTRSRKP
jgi:hypothetical protein